MQHRAEIDGRNEQQDYKNCDVYCSVGGIIGCVVAAGYPVGVYLLGEWSAMVDYVASFGFQFRGKFSITVFHLIADGFKVGSLLDKYRCGDVAEIPSAPFAA